MFVANFDVLIIIAVINSQIIFSQLSIPNKSGAFSGGGEKKKSC
jgi:hypothetical protein